MPTDPDLFRPDAVLARDLEDRMRTRLAGSFQHILEACREYVRLDEAAVNRTIARIRSSGRVRTDLFIIHRQCANAAGSSNLPDIAAAFDALCHAPVEAPPGLQLRNWGDASFQPGERERYHWVFGAGESPLDLQPATPSAFQLACDAMEGARGVLKRSDPVHLAEIDALVHEVVFAQGETAASMTFDGITAFVATYSLLLNAAEHRTIPGALAGLVHEAAHSLIYAAAEGAPMVENDPDERYASPLRPDPRPMDGVFHASFVAARMAYALDRALAADAFAAPDQPEAARLLAGAKRAFASGYATVRTHGRPTALGRRMIDDAADAMGLVSAVIAG